jgi:quercetin dioxygenase-like cupin family protein
MSEKPVLRKSTESDAYWFLGGLYEVLLSSDDTNGAATIVQFTIPVGMGPPPHTHDGNESVYIVEGTLKYNINGELLEAGPGAVIYLPAGTLETFEPTTTIKIVATYTPGGLDKFFAEAGERAPKREIPPPPTSQPDFEHLAQVAAKHGLHIQPPPGS